MDAVILCEFGTGDAHLRAGILARFSTHALAGEGRLSFVATESDESGRPVSETVALAFADIAIARAAMLRWRRDPDFPAALRLRLLRIEPVWAMEPLPLMFP